MKRVLTVLLALALMLALAVPAMATETNPGSITIDNAVVGKTYTIYRIFNLDSHNADYTAFNYKVNPDWRAFFTADAKGLEYVDIDEMGYVTWKKDASAADFAADAIKFAKDNGIGNNGEKKADSATVQFTNLELGYYLVKSDLGALCSLDTTTPAVTIKEKNGAPTIDKQVQEDSKGDFGKHNDADVGQTVNFKTTINVVDGQPKGYVLHDTMSDGLTFDTSSVVVKIGDRTLTAGEDYNLVTEGLTDGCTFEVRFVDGKLKPNDVVVVTYSATVNANAVVGGKGNANSTKLEYLDTNNVKQTTEPSETRTYTWQMDVFKYAKNGEEEIKLSGAQFVLYKTVDGKTLYAQADASYKITGWTETEAEATKFTTPENGTFTISGLDADTYYLKETAAPAGYNLLKDPIKVVITASVDEQTGDGTATVTYNETSTGTVRVENKTGVELPSTGGVGTTVFYVVGGLLVAVALVLLVTKKKMSVNK